MERELLLLGLLRGHEMHGYQIYEFIGDSLGANAHLTKPTVYRLLNSMADKGWVTGREEQEGKRPSRRVYAITPAGEDAFQRLLRQSLAGYRPLDLLGDAALLFLDALSTGEALALLRERRTAVAALLQAVQERDEPPGGAAWLLERRRTHLATELGWMEELVARLASPEQSMPPSRDLPPSPASRSKPARRRAKSGWSPEFD